MKHIIVAITPDADGVRCPKCRFLVLNGSQWWCRLHDDYVGFYANPAIRPEFCLAAERKLAALTRERDAFAERWRKTDEEVERLKELLREYMSVCPTPSDYGYPDLEDQIRAALGKEGK